MSFRGRCSYHEHKPCYSYHPKWWSGTLIRLSTESKLIKWLFRKVEFGIGEWVKFKGVEGMTEINGVEAKVRMLFLLGKFRSLILVSA